MQTTFIPTFTAARRVNVLWSNVALGILALVALLVHSYNMFGFPLYLGDEGIYMSQAYATLKLGQITPYAYWYDHAPAGWILIAVWSIFTGGFHTFGTAIAGGRVLMLLLHVASLVLLFRVALRLTANTFVATAVGLLYALSPLAVIYGRMVLLDNIMVFWALLAMVLLLRHNGKIWPLLYSGGCFGMAVLSKESAILFMPAFLYGLWTLVEKHHARFARAAWLFAALGTISLYFLYAALRKELIDWSFSTPLAVGNRAVTLFGAILWQMNRSGGAPWDPASDFFRLLTTNWFIKDPWLIGLGATSTLWNLFRGDHRRRLVGLLSLLAILGVMHGGVVLDFYIIALLPFLALNVGLAAEDLASLMHASALLPAMIVAAMVIGWVNLDRQHDLFTLDLTTTQRQALSWVQEHVPPKAQLLIDDDLWVDLRDGVTGKPSFPGAHSHWKVANDPAVYHDLFHDDWHNIDYLIMTPGLDKIYTQERDKLTYAAYSHSTPVAHFDVGGAAVEIRKVDNAGIAAQETLAQSYRSFRARFIHDGQVRPERGYVDARDQATGMLMAVWMDDQKTFNDLWDWTRMHLQSANGLLYQTNQPGARLQTTTDADTDTALALLLAERRWSDASYGRYGKQIVAAIWDHEVVEIAGAPYLAAGDWAVTEKQVIFAPATFAPYAYHFFAVADPQHNWWYLLATNYRFLSAISSAQLGVDPSAGLPPAYLGIDRDSGAFLPNPAGAPAANNFDEQAAQAYWRVGLDAQWHDDARADRFLTASGFLHDEWQAKGNLAASYSHLGKPQTRAENLILYSAVLPKFMIEDPAAAHQLYATKLTTAFNQGQNEGQWGDGSDIAQQRWAWLATGLYANALQYQWNTNR
jgi:endo-1,4-beta-D-glucanase Y